MDDYDRFAKWIIDTADRLRSNEKVYQSSHSFDSRHSIHMHISGAFRNQYDPVVMDCVNTLLRLRDMEHLK